MVPPAYGIVPYTVSYRNITRPLSSPIPRSLPTSHPWQGIQIQHHVLPTNPNLQLAADHAVPSQMWAIIQSRQIKRLVILENGPGQAITSSNADGLELVPPSELW